MDKDINVNHIYSYEGKCMETGYCDLDYRLNGGLHRGELYIIGAHKGMGKIGLDMLLTAYRKVIIDEFADDVMLYHWYADEVLELAGLHDVVEQKRKDGLND